MHTALTAISALYALLVARRNRRFDAGRGVHRADLPVVSVGNLSMGGTGKSPFVVLLAGMLRELGFTPAVVSRGYGRRSRGVVVVADHDRILTDAATAGDELSMLARLLPGTVIVAAEQRRLGCSRIRRHYPFVDVVLLDDGFQHRQLARDADIVLVDRDTVDRPFIMPRGVLREPLDGLRRASLVVTTPGVHEDEIRPFTTAPVVHVHTEVAGWMRYGTSSDGSPHAETALKPDRVVLITAIANAARVTSTCADQGVTVMHHAEYRDHHAFTPQDVQKVMAHCRRIGCGTLLATEKDLPKLLPYLERLAASELELVVLRIRSVCSDPARVRDLLLETVRTWRRVHAKTTDDTSDART